jgi:hypothetical protein
MTLPASQAMASDPAHRIVTADTYRVPRPFSAFAVRSEEPRHAFDARAPYARVHVVRTDFLDAGSIESLAALGYARVSIEHFSDIDYANTTLEELAAASPRGTDLAEGLAGALRLTGVLGEDPASYRSSAATRIDFLASRGAGFHNDVRGHWSGCLFWILALDVANLDFVMPHAGVQVPLLPGDLVVFDPAMAHGLCRPGDSAQALETSFLGGEDCRQIFLTGELPLTDARWAALGAPWLPIEEHERRGALDLAVAEFDDRNGAIKRPGELRDCMKRSTCHVDDSTA